MSEDFFTRRRDIRDARPIHVKALLESSLFTDDCWFHRCDQAFVDAMRKAYPELEVKGFKRKSYRLHE